MTTATAPAEPLARVRIVIACDRYGCTAESGAWYRVPRRMLLPDRYALHRAQLTSRRGWTHNRHGDDLCPKHGDDAHETAEVTP
jgi:hypothetical protein